MLYLSLIFVLVARAFVVWFLDLWIDILDVRKTF